MPFAQMTDGAPIVEVFDRHVRLYATDHTAPDGADADFGFIFDRPVALATGLRLLAALQESDPTGLPMFEIESFDAGIVRNKDNASARLEFVVQGTKLAVTVDAKQLSQIVALFAETAARL